MDRGWWLGVDGSLLAARGWWLTVRAALLVGLLNAAPVVAAEASDPIERVNRGTFWFNQKLDDYVLEPAARGWHFVVPDPIETSIGNFFDHIRLPTNLVNDLLQGKPKRFGIDLARFGINTLIGFFGTLDPAAQMGLERGQEDFGQTLGVWRAPAGPYVEIPFMGPSCVRDIGGTIVDSITAVYPWYIPFFYTSGMRAVDVVNYRAANLDEIERVKEASLDLYVTVRDGYLQRRRAMINDDAKLTEEEEHELYYEDFD